MPKSATVVMTQVFEGMEIPDEFSIIVRGTETNTILEWEEVYKEPEEVFFALADKDDIMNDKRTQVKYEDGRGIIKFKDEGTRKKILSWLLSEAVLEAKYYLNDDEIMDIVDSIRVHKSDKEGSA
ncbi:MAG: hypothetical protein QW393_03395 [Candidatus Micrarchaeaceae archaeon]